MSHQNKRFHIRLVALDFIHGFFLLSLISTSLLIALPMSSRKEMCLLITSFAVLLSVTESFAPTKPSYFTKGALGNPFRYTNHQQLQLTADEFDGDDDDEDEDVSNDQSDWLTAQATLLDIPTYPHPDLSPLHVATTCIRSLQFVDKPRENSGLERCFPFLTWECRKLVTARKGGDTVERFCTYGILSPALQPFMGAHRVVLGEITILPANPPVRGSIASFPIAIRTSPIFSVTHMSGMERGGVANPPVVNMVMRLEQQRRPPNQGCWLVKEIMDVRMAFAGDMGNAGVAN